jgi:SAM-dependent methyltransferase
MTEAVTGEGEGSGSGESCRLCGVELRRVFIDLGMSPLSNAYLRAEQLHRMEPFYPLRVYVCQGCLLVQLPVAQRAAEIFGDEYLYFSSYSESWLRHCEAYAGMACERFGLNDRSLVVELASNDGYLLQYFKRRHIPVLGVEPSRNVAQVAVEQRGIPTLARFFGRELASELRAQGQAADLIVANNVLAHVPDLHDFLAGIATLLRPGGVCTVEFPHLLRLMQENQFDTIYHEHFSYFSLLTARRAFAQHGLDLFDVDELPTHGGSLRLYARPRAAGATPSEKVALLEKREAAAGLGALEGYLGFRSQVERCKRDLLSFLIKARQEGKRVVGYGAPAKGNTLLNYCGVREDLIDFTVDRSPHKQGRYLPGTHIPIRAPQDLQAARPDYILILPWNLKEEIVEQLADARTWGARFVVPIPRIELLE